MRKFLGFIILILLGLSLVQAQESGNRTYGTQRRKPQENSGVLSAVVNNKEVYFVEANVLMNVKPDSFVVVFAIVQEGATASESNSKLNTQIDGFVRDLEKVGIKKTDTFVDFIAQNKIYDFTTTGTVITEKFSGFETKKNINIRYKDREILEKILDSAVKASIFDLIEVQYVINDMSGVNAKLFSEAVKSIKQKEANYANAFGIKFSPTNVSIEKYDTFYPAELYGTYQAFEGGTTYNDYNRTVIRQRKTRTFFYEPLDVSKFDTVINQPGIEPMVQFTLYLRMQYDLKK